jgi:predicted RNA-binding Zn-ribbon protein involved in translation (DUF1610 family)
MISATNENYEKSDVVRKHMKCRHCGLMITFEQRQDGLYCPECGWEYNVSESYANKKQKTIFRELFKGIAVIIVKSLPFILLGLFVLFFFGNSIYEAISISSVGKPAIATVAKYDPLVRHRRSRRIVDHYHILEYGQYSKRIDLGIQYPVGTQFHILYNPNKPTMIKFSKKGDNAVTIFLREQSLWMTILLIVLSIFWLMSGIWSWTNIGSAIRNYRKTKAIMKKV